MSLAGVYTDNTLWTGEEKRVARKAFGTAYIRRCAPIAANVKKMMENSSEPDVIWEVHDYLSKERKEIDRVFDYRYSRLIIVFTALMGQGLLTEADLVGLSQDKIERIKQGAALFSGEE